jgi:hypothetical protein
MALRVPPLHVATNETGSQFDIEVDTCQQALFLCTGRKKPFSVSWTRLSPVVQPRMPEYMWFSQGCRNIYVVQRRMPEYICGSAKDAGIYVVQPRMPKYICGSAKDAGIFMWFTQ